MTVIIIDAGNTKIKVGTYKNDVLIDVSSCQTKNELIDFLHSTFFDHCFLSSVLSKEITEWILHHAPSIRLFDEKVQLPIQLDYQTPLTLGKDRIANAIEGNRISERKNALIIDLGTCIKFDFISSEGVFKGGSIAPGMRMRFKAMHQFTGKLPMIENFAETKLIGNSTVNCMVSGVMNGIHHEIVGMIEQYKREFKDLIIFATGGDLPYFNLFKDMHIQCEQHLTINGLYTLLKKQL